MIPETMNQPPTYLLLIEDNPGDVRLIQEMLLEAPPPGFVLHHATRLQHALELMASQQPDAVLLDLGLPDTEDLEGLAAIVRSQPNLPVVVLTGLSDEDTGNAAVRAGAQDFLTKGEVTGALLIRTLRYAISRQRLKSDLEQATAELRRSENRLRLIIEQNSDGMLIVSQSGIVRFVNPAAEKILGRPAESLLGNPFGFPLDSSATSELAIAQDDGQTLVCEMQLVETEWEGEGVFLAALRDITARRDWEARIRYAQKMEAIGNLTRGIAHDFNNILAAIVGYASVLDMRLDSQESLRTPVQQILAAADRATVMTRALISFSRNQPSQIRNFDLREMVARVGGMLPSLLGSSIDFTTDLTGQPLQVLADSAQIEQVLINLTVNARQAMPQGGRLHLQLEETTLGLEFRKRRGFGRVGRFACIRMIDNGPGMEQELCDKIFDPFFTTREPGEGDGLGLSIAYGIVKQHRGYILCNSRPGEGTTFEIFLPLTETPNPPEQGE